MRLPSVGGRIRLHPYVDVRRIPADDPCDEVLRRLSAEPAITIHDFQWDLDRTELSVRVVFECRRCCMRATFMGPLVVVGTVECPCGEMVRGEMVRVDPE